jgi:hypothetical protein
MGFECYRSLPTLRHFLLIAQDRVSIDRYSRDADGRWVLESANGPNAVIQLADIGCVLPAAEVYAKVGSVAASG